MPFFGGGSGGGGDYVILTHGNINGAGSGAMPLLTGVNNAALGLGAINGVTTGSDNIALGDSAGISLTTANNCVLIGSSAATSLTTNSHCIIIGKSAADNFATGRRNVIIGVLGSNGFPAMNSLTSGSRNVLMGANNDFVSGDNANVDDATIVGIDAEGVSGCVAIGSSAYAGTQSAAPFPCVAVGAYAGATGLNGYATALGTSANAAQTNVGGPGESIAIGGLSAAGSNSIAISAAVGDNQLSIGNVNQHLVLIGGYAPVRLLDVDNTSVTLPADTATHIVHTFTIPAKTLLGNGVADIFAWFDTGIGNAAGGTFSVKANGTNIGTFTATSTTLGDSSALLQLKIKNISGNQINMLFAIPGAASNSPSLSTSAINYDANVTITISAKKNISADTITYRFSECTIIGVS